VEFETEQLPDCPDKVRLWPEKLLFLLRAEDVRLLCFFEFVCSDLQRSRIRSTAKAEVL